jgi:hypothetical protein
MFHSAVGPQLPERLSWEKTKKFRFAFAVGPDVSIGWRNCLSVTAIHRDAQRIFGAAA